MRIGQVYDSGLATLVKCHLFKLPPRLDEPLFPQLRQRPARYLHRLVDVVVGVYRAHQEPRPAVHSMVVHRQRELVLPHRVGHGPLLLLRQHDLVVVGVHLDAQPQEDRRGDARRGARDLHPVQQPIQAVPQPCCGAVGIGVDRLRLHQLQGLLSGGRRQRVSVERAVVADARAAVEAGLVPQLDHVDDLGLAGHRPAGQPAAEYLGQRAHVGRHSV